MPRFLTLLFICLAALAQAKARCAFLRLAGGVNVVVAQNSDGPSIHYYRELDAPTLIQAGKTFTERLKNAWKQLKARSADAEVTEALAELQKAPQSEEMHKQLAIALQKALVWRGVTTELNRADDGTYQLSMLAHDGKNQDTAWLVDISRLLNQSEGVAVGLKYDTGLAVRQVNHYLINGGTGERTLSKGIIPTGEQKYSITPYDVHELYHWMQDQLRLVHNPDAWAPHLLQMPLGWKLTAPGQENNPLLPFAAEEVSRRSILGFTVEENGAHALEYELTREILTGTLNQRQDRATLERAIRSLQLNTMQIALAEASLANYDHLLAALDAKTLKLDLKKGRVHLATRDRYELALLSYSPPAETLKAYRENLAALRADLVAARQKVVEQQKNLSTEQLKIKKLARPIFTSFAKDFPAFQLIGKKDGNVHIVKLTELARWADTP